MSLINDALKKAQKQRTGDAPPLAAMPPIGGESATRIAKRTKPPGFNTLLIRLGLGAAGLLAVVIVGFLVLRQKAAPAPSPVEHPPVAAAPAPATSTPAVPATKTPETTFVLPIAKPPEPVVVAKVEPPAPKPETPAPTATVPSKAEPAKPAARLEPRAISYIDNIRVAGIRASANDSKVLMNDRVYRTGDTVEHELGIKLVGITANSLVFEDRQGARYTRNF